MTNEATRLMDAALKGIDLHSSFSPEELGSRIGLNKHQAESAARELSNAGVLALGFDCAAHFTADFRKVRTKAAQKKRPAKR